MKMGHVAQHGISNHRQFDCFFNNVSRLTTKKTWKIRITGPFWVECTSDGWTHLTDHEEDITMATNACWKCEYPRCDGEICYTTYLITNFPATNGYIIQFITYNRYWKTMGSLHAHHKYIYIYIYWVDLNMPIAVYHAITNISCGYL